MLASYWQTGILEKELFLLLNDYLTFCALLQAHINQLLLTGVARWLRLKITH